MSNENTALQINFKTKKDGMLINLRADNAAQLDELIDIVSQRLAALIDLEHSFESAAHSAGVTQNIATQLGGQVISQGTVQTAPHVAPAAPAYTPASPVAVPNCTCGAGAMRLVKAGISKTTGKPYRAFYACPQPQGQACNNRVNA